MTINISPDLEQIVHGIYAGGGYASEADVISDALHLLQQREQLRNDLRRGVKEPDQGERVDGDEVFKGLRQRATALDQRDR
jgi:Arc/MetJ-type ribon-helix-helix transcriptional regulator